MGNYRKMYEEASKKKSLHSITPVYREWGKEGDRVIGAYVSKAEVVGRLGGQTYNQYVFDTDEGLVKLSLGKATDNEVGQSFREGVIYGITFQGKEKIAGGRTVNKFLVEEVGGVEAEEAKAAES